MALDESHRRNDGGGGTVLVVDDEPHLVGMYAAMLEDDHTVRTATSGAKALDHLSADVDVALLDRRMPELSGDDVLEVIREEGYDCRVAMVTSVDPDVDIVRMGFDAYLVKPVRQADLRAFVDNLLLRLEYGRDTREVLSLTSKIVALESQFGEEALASHEEYQRLRERRKRLDDANRERIAELLDSDDPCLVFRNILRELLDG